MKKLTKSLVMVSTIAMATSAHAALIVDFNASAPNTHPDAASFVVTAAPTLSITTANGVQGYTGPDFGTVTSTLSSFSTAGLTTANMRNVNRGSGTTDLVSDWASIEPGVGAGNVPIIGLQLNLTGLNAGEYSFNGQFNDTSNQNGVLDAQYSIDGGVNWVDTAYDNASYNSGVNVALSITGVNATNGISLRFIAGGGLFGDAGVNTDASANNRLLPFQSFDLAAVPEPSSTALLGLGGLALILRRRK